ncbi:glycosyltransferase family 2 protein [Mucilaginibacter rubeus]|uniref:Glycosyltransferase family 2 protein n=1 Tax=Mucilaginibacter rubeus TaxID=2027860 RepID=A0AAE6JGF3_9SPHI|nr:MULTISPECIES: glycosyltransferase family 2 protein [Mucilaginibacter]QEM04292.1 glycosyltransferase family 2 protein [Mucilaginibacter rubeus]QEM16891.1 glycosyltransferase family 2 protein [Mucilaginibacter gossypii]QTE46621.1 glycosyltransferase family 2 protein [Mucilaginibacter rubeus]QTE53218.1 glycosyltransferase family 2 protein [Mucilaginibacter rubeus]QTE58306.1 glycosyltransferase family 2 protein [Mucilaginibacter rubeus]
MKIILAISLFIVFYTFAGYGIFLYLIIRIKRAFKGRKALASENLDELPSCTLVIAAYNEEYFIEQKISNSLLLNYPEGKLKLLFVTDGSSDKTPDIVARYPQIQLLHQPQRAGKIAAVHRAMNYVDTDAVVFTDANTFLNKDALIKICRHYSDATVGAVAGEKRVHIDENADASAAGEGFYWKYESALKKWDSELYSVVGAAGELFSVRRSLYQPVEADTVLDDFMISMLIAAKGYRIIYEPEAYATETASENVSEELKRKVRIAAGGMQSILRLKKLFNPFPYPILSFQYISHRVLRWTVTPFLLILSFILNVVLALKPGETAMQGLLLAQILFYLLALLGLIMEKRQLRIKVLFIPYYFCVMNYAVLAGIIRYFSTRQSAVWEKVQRKQ